jgi:hypothetical protein
MNVPVSVPSSNDGGCGLPGDRARRTPARWSANTSWVDRDGLPLPPEMLVIGQEIVLRRWQNKRPEYITGHPLPNVDELNATIPIDQWELGLDGKPSKPWKITYVVYLVDLKTGALYMYAHDTFGAMQCYHVLEERIAVIRMLRGEHVFPIVRLEKRSWKSATYGIQMRPHLEPTGDWRTPGGLQSAPQSPAPQIGGPSTSTPPASTPTTPTTPSSTPSTPTAPPPAAAASAPPSSTILDHTKPVKPVTVGELIADELPPWA